MLLKQIQKIHTQWLRQAQPPNLLLHGAWACRRHHYFYCIKICALYRTSLMFLWELKNAIISQNLRGLCDIKTNIKTTHSGFDKLSHLLFHYTLPEPVEGTFSLLISAPEPVEGRSYSSLWFLELRSQTFSLCSITILFITTLGAWTCRRHILNSHLGAWACRRHIISIALKIRVLSRTSLMFLWELKNGIISQNLRGLCVIKANTNIPHIVASTSSATKSFSTRCLSL